ncbi:nicotinamide riboside transporter PnuC [Nonomuraea endophytica]|uniref:nicotinamide riboside transporter PnuC n=1 Tax=Nonomuraea endophytica TaxID=714136 RepID=UPI0037CA68B7
MSWADASINVFGLPVKWTDLLGNVFAVATVLFAMRRSIWTWPVQFTGAVLLFIASVSAHVTGNALKQVLFGALAVYGWWKWRQGTQGGKALEVRPARMWERVGLITAMLLGTALVGTVFYGAWVLFELPLSWGVHSPAPESFFLVAADAYIFVGGAVATWAQGRALVDFWIVWMAVDLVGVPLLFRSQLYVSGAVYGLFFILVLIGFVKWLREYHTRTAELKPMAVAT